MPAEQTLTLRQPDDWHLHLRDGALLQAVIASSARDFRRAIVMPNLIPPVVTAADAIAYRQRIRDALAASPAGNEQGAGFTPLMTLYLTDNTDADDVRRAAADGIIHAVKLYPAGATTNSDSGVTDIDAVMPVLETMAEESIVLCIHGEITDASVDIFDREARFIDQVLVPLRARLPDLRIVLEHVTTREGIDFVRSQSANQAATLTPHHLMLNRNHLLVGGIRPHYYCLPVLKRDTHRQALVAAATSGDARFFLGTDSAPHTTSTKECACGCAGCFNAPTTLSCLAAVFEAAGALHHLEAFASLNGPAFYGLEPNPGTLTLERRSQPVEIQPVIDAGEETVTVFDPGVPLYWHVARDDAAPASA